MKKKFKQSSEVTELLRPFLPWIMLSAGAGIAAGAATVTLLDTINHVLHYPERLTGNLLLVFTVLCIVVLIGRMVSDMSTNLVGQRLVAQIRKTLARKILGAPIDALERYRTHRLMPVLTQDIDMISDVAFTLASTVIAIAIVLGCLGYLAWLSPQLFVLLIVALIVGATVQAWAQARGVAGFWKARDLEEILHKAYRGISDGAKELRMHRSRRSRVLGDQIDLTVDKIRAINQKAINTYVMATAFGSALFFMLIAVVLWWAAIQHPAPEVVSGFVMVLLFLKGPMEQIIETLPGIGRAKVAFQRIKDLSVRFANPEAYLNLAQEPSMISLNENIQLVSVRYAFSAPEGGEMKLLSEAQCPMPVFGGLENKEDKYVIVTGGAGGQNFGVPNMMVLYNSLDFSQELASVTTEDYIYEQVTRIGRGRYVLGAEDRIQLISIIMTSERKPVIKFLDFRNTKSEQEDVSQKIHTIENSVYVYRDKSIKGCEIKENKFEDVFEVKFDSRVLLLFDYVNIKQSHLVIVFEDSVVLLSTDTRRIVESFHDFSPKITRASSVEMKDHVLILGSTSQDLVVYCFKKLNGKLTLHLQQKLNNVKYSVAETCENLMSVASIDGSLLIYRFDDSLSQPLKLVRVIKGHQLPIRWISMSIEGDNVSLKTAGVDYKIRKLEFKYQPKSFNVYLSYVVIVTMIVISVIVAYLN